MKKIFLKLYLYSISKGYKVFKKLHYMSYAITYLKSAKGGFWYRDEGNKIRSQDIIQHQLHNNSLEKLTKGLSQKDKGFITYMFDKIKLISENNIIRYKDIISDQEEKEQQSFAKFCLNNPDKYFDLEEISSRLNMFYQNTLYEIPHARSYIQKKNIIDCGGYIADTAVIFEKVFDSEKIYTFEPNKENYQRAKKTIQDHKLTNKIIPINLGLGGSKHNAKVIGKGAGSKIVTNGVGTNISITTIDDFVKKEKTEIGLIKRDIEGMEYESILGAEKTIKEQKPILLISIYHTGKDFFEIKPLLESWDIGYRFTFIRWNCFHPFADILLVCY